MLGISDGLVFPIRLAGSEEAEDEGQWKLYFKLYCFLDVESMPKEGVEFAFMFEQVDFSPHLTFQPEGFSLLKPWVTPICFRSRHTRV